MLKINIKNDISITRGDSGELNVILTDISGEVYEMQSGDTLQFTVREKIGAEDTEISKTVIGENVIELTPSDTKTLPYGRYVYDIQLTTEFGKVYTVIPPAGFYVCEEVTE